MIELACFIIGLIFGWLIKSKTDKYKKLRLRKAIDAAFKKLDNMSDEEFDKEIEKHKSGDIATFLIEMMEFSKSNGITYD